MRKIKSYLASGLFLLAILLCSANVKAAGMEPSLKLKETESRNVYEVTIENWDTDACGVEVHLTADTQIGEYEYTPRLESEGTFNLARTEGSGGKTTFYIYLSRQAPISNENQVTLGILDLSKSGKPGIVSDSGYVKTVGADYTEAMLQEAGIKVDSGPDSGDSGNSGDNGNSGDHGNSGDNGNSGDHGNNGNNSNNGDDSDDQKDGTGTGNEDSKKSTVTQPVTSAPKKTSSTTGQTKKNDGTTATSDTTESSEAVPKDGNTDKDDNKSGDGAESTEQQSSDESSQVPVVAPQEEQEVKKSGINILPVVIIIVVLAVVCGGVVLLFRFKNKEK